MIGQSRLTHLFVERVPEQLEDGILYISIPFAMVIHRCCCGCGSEVATPLSPTDWRLTFDGESVSLHPSIGRWGLPCRSHYWIEKSQVRWAPSWSRQQIDAGRAADRAAKSAYYGAVAPVVPGPSRATPGRPWWRRLFRLN